MVTKPSTEQTQDFSIHNEDFPALPGPNYKDPTLSNDDNKTVSEAAGTGKPCAPSPGGPWRGGVVSYRLPVVPSVRLARPRFVESELMVHRSPSRRT